MHAYMDSSRSRLTLSLSQESRHHLESSESPLEESGLQTSGTSINISEMKGVGWQISKKVQQENA